MLKSRSDISSAPSSAEGLWAGAKDTRTEKGIKEGGRFPERFVAGLIVVGLVVAVALLAEGWAVRRERAAAVRMAVGASYQRDLGVALARAAFRQPGILPLYGSSELEIDVPNRAPDFFSNAPDGFRVCPLGRRGASPLLLLERVAGAGRAPAGGKAVVLISQVWFLSRGATLSTYAGNFSALQAMELIFKAPLSAELRRDIARRMLDYPETLAGTPVLEQGVRAAAHIDTPAGRIAYWLLLPLGRMETKVMEMQDHLESMREVGGAPSTPSPAPLPPAAPDWTRLIAAADAQARPLTAGAETLAAEPKRLAGVWRGIKAMPDCTEWQDLDLLVRTFRELHIEPLLLDIPWFAPYYDQCGVNAGIRDSYYARLRSLAAKYQVPVATYQDHEYDLNFLYDPHSHLSAKGWIFFNRDMDAFWRGLPVPDR